MKKLSIIFTLLAVSLTGLWSCGEDKTEDKIPVEKISVIPTQTTLEVGQTLTLEVSILPEKATVDYIAYSSNNTGVASVSGQGVITAVAKGSANITVTVQDKTAVCLVTVNEKTVEVQSIMLDKAQAVLETGQSLLLKATVMPENATDKTVVWSSSNEQVATVDQTGKVTAVAVGSAKITASAGEVSIECTVTVNEATVEVESITISEKEVNMTVGDKKRLSAAVMPENASDTAVVWTSSNENVVAVDKDGRLTALSAGDAEITASAGGKSDVCSVTVKEKTIDVESVILSENDIAIKVGDEKVLTVTVMPEDATDKTVVWSSSDQSIVTVAPSIATTTDQSCKITAVAVGSAKITASAGEVKAECTVTVTAATVEVESVTIDKKEMTLDMGTSAQLTATVLPENATDKTVVWSSSNEQVATVDQSGKVTAVAVGSADITAKAGEKSAVCNVTVEKPAEVIAIGDAAFKKYLVDTFDTDKDGEITVEQAAAITAIECPAKGISSLAGIEYFTALQTLDCSGNDLAQIDLSKNTALKILNCSSNKLSSLTPADCPALVSLDCSNNQIAGIYIGENKSLTDFNCAGNNLSMLYLVENGALKSLNCSSNKISALNLSSNTGLTSLECSGNSISSLDVSAILGLTLLDCSGNGSLATLTANNLASLAKLDCSNCNLSSLMVSGNSALTYLDFTNNKVAGIWLGLNKKLENLYCSGNKITYLNLADNTALALVICGKQSSALTLKLPDELKSKWDIWKNIPNNADVTLE